MPNWCDNSLEVIGNEEEIKRFYETGIKVDEDKTERWSLEPYYPIPDEVEKCHWCDENWGTKWDANDPQWGIDDNCFSVSFLSAWSPPIGWLEKVQDDYKNLHFKLSYLEEGMHFTGIAHTISDGKGHVFINDICEDICEYVNGDDESVYCDEEKGIWIVSSTGEAMDEDDYTSGVNHLEKRYQSLERERKINEILES